MKAVIVDREKCIGCGACVKDCPGTTMQMVDAKAEALKDCIECGHCYAVCPVGAITMDGYDVSNVGEMQSMTQFDSDMLLQAMKSRRTIRQYKNIPVEQEKIDKILEAGRYCPTAANSQNVAYTILGSKQDEIEKECVKVFRTGIKAGSPFSAYLKRQVIDDNFFFKGAPLVIVVSGTSATNPNLASSYMELMANSLGLGVLYSGFFIVCSRVSPKIRKMLDLPKGHKPISCMIFGYPDVKYHRIVPRKKLNVKELQKK